VITNSGRVEREPFWSSSLCHSGGSAMISLSLQGRSEAMLAEIAAGRFPPDPDQVTCPRCPHFFVCDATGRGPLSLSDF